MNGERGNPPFAKGGAPMPAASEALTRARREEIINACAALYETMGFREISDRKSVV